MSVQLGPCVEQVLRCLCAVKVLKMFIHLALAFTRAAQAHYEALSSIIPLS